MQKLFEFYEGFIGAENLIYKVLQSYVLRFFCLAAGNSMLFKINR